MGSRLIINIGTAGDTYSYDLQQKAFESSSILDADNSTYVYDTATSPQDEIRVYTGTFMVVAAIIATLIILKLTAIFLSPRNDRIAAEVLEMDMIPVNAQADNERQLPDLIPQYQLPDIISQA
ncbi:MULTISPECIES: hypothetical protein [Candidatus Ichthyocystis]|uniref:hypothetical protein n=1 Tax=Candidatus Ichthyocystis TaxID=2929841 RepID=UPI000B865A38|nr:MULTISPECIES: hypothetical protein [Ichthyocystis]